MQNYPWPESYLTKLFMPMLIQSNLSIVILYCKNCLCPCYSMPDYSWSIFLSYCTNYSGPYYSMSIYSWSMVISNCTIPNYSKFPLFKVPSCPILSDCCHSVNNHHSNHFSPPPHHEFSSSTMSSYCI